MGKISQWTCYISFNLYFYSFFFVCYCHCRHCRKNDLQLFQFDSFIGYIGFCTFRLFYFCEWFFCCYPSLGFMDTGFSSNKCPYFSFALNTISFKYLISIRNQDKRTLSRDKTKIIFIKYQAFYAMTEQIEKI